MATPANILPSNNLLSVPSAGQEHVNEELQSVGIYQDLVKYEEMVQELSKSVDTFKPDVSLVTKLIECDRKLYETLEEFDEYYKIEEELDKLNEEQKEIDNKTKHVLETLNECYNSLNQLPMLEQVEFEQETILKQRERIHTKVVLDYAMKLAKFTRFPPTFDKSIIGPNNFIWPAEDSLRRGMLAIASLKSKELLGEMNEDEEHVENKAAKETETNSESERRNSYEFTANGKEESEDKSNPQVDVDLDLDLDLFNPDDF